MNQVTMEMRNLAQQVHDMACVVRNLKRKRDEENDAPGAAEPPDAGAHGDGGEEVPAAAQAGGKGGGKAGDGGKGHVGKGDGVNNGKGGNGAVN